MINTILYCFYKLLYYLYKDFIDFLIKIKQKEKIRKDDIDYIEFFEEVDKAKEILDKGEKYL